MPCVVCWAVTTACSFGVNICQLRLLLACFIADTGLCYRFLWRMILPREPFVNTVNMRLSGL